MKLFIQSILLCCLLFTVGFSKDEKFKIETVVSNLAIPWGDDIY